MRNRDFLKKKAKQTGDPLIWEKYKDVRNCTSNEIKKAKSQYFTNKKNPRSTWKLINKLNSRNTSSNKTISNIKLDDEILTTPKAYC